MSPLSLSLFFALGIFLQGVIALLISGNLRRFIALTFFAGAVSCLSLFVIPQLASQSFDNRLFSVAVLFSLLFSTGIAFFFKAGIIRAINERYLFLINIVFVYFLFASHTFTNFDGVLLWFILIATAFTLFNAFTKNPLLRSKKIFLYMWLIFMSSVMMTRDLFLWFKTDSTLYPELYTPFAVIIKGMSFCMLFSYVSYLLFFLLFGLLDFDKALKISRTHPTLRNIIDKRFSNEQLSKYEALIILIVSGGTLIANHLLQIVHYQLLVGILIVFLPLISKTKH